MSDVARTPLLALSGGVPLRAGEDVIGAVGVFGSDHDEEIADE
jgi:uncharacterized protein GlcG (DUF336 family)